MTRFQDQLSSTVLQILRAVDGVLFDRLQQTARRNAWEAVCADRRRACARENAARVLARLAEERSASIEHELEHTTLV
jgi:hypothetical protein